ncbi:MAG: FAD-dependent oxidoreductase, partial [Phycisphaerales bacterium]|nr:FAD-dependent oxidoreductase [Phycisphaerales bacterium]
MTIRSIAVVGAGPAGLVAAQRLSSAGHDVVVLEKSRGVGGRTSTRRSDSEVRFDHGCQFVSRIDSSPGPEISAWTAGGFVDRWSPRLAPGTTTPEFAGEHWSIGVPAMNSMMRHLAEGIDV